MRSFVNSGNATASACGRPRWAGKDAPADQARETLNGQIIKRLQGTNMAKREYQPRADVPSPRLQRCQHGHFDGRQSSWSQAVLQGRQPTNPVPVERRGSKELREEIGEAEWPKVAFAFHTGLPASRSVFDCLWADVNFDTGTRSGARKTKSGRDYFVPMNDEATERSWERSGKPITEQMGVSE